MNSGQMTDFIGQIAEAYQALQERPQLRAEIERLKDASFTDGNRIADLEQRIAIEKQEVSDTLTKLRSLEVERDQAQFQVLELEERLHNLVGSIVKFRTDFAIAESELMHAQVVAEAKPQPTPEIPAENTPTTGPSVSLPLPNATVTVVDMPITTASETAINGESVSSNSDLLYLDKFYHDIPHFVPYADWIAGGGTEYTYYWRPNNVNSSL